MSFDTKLLRYCDHRIIEEDHVVDDIDFKTVFLNSIVSSENDVVVRINDTIFVRDNKIESLIKDDVTSQVTGLNSSFTVENAFLFNGANKSQMASINDVVVQIKIVDEDASAQFTGNDNLLVTQHRKLISEYSIYASKLSVDDVVVKVNNIKVEISSIDALFGKIVLVNKPLLNDIVTVTYFYKAKVLSINPQAGLIDIKEKPQVGDIVNIYYYHLINDGWKIKIEKFASQIIFDLPKQSNQFLINDEDVSSQFNGLIDRFYTKNKPIIPPRANIDTQPESTIITQIVVKLNGTRITPLNLNANTGLIVLGIFPKKDDVVTITYHYRDENYPVDLISVNYQVDVNKCAKCKRIGQLNDFDFDKLGELILVQDEEKLLQDVMKFTIAIKGSNKAHIWWGTTLNSYVGTARVNDYYKPKFKSEIISAGDKIKDLQIQQTQYQTVSDEEFFSHFENITVEQSDYNPNFYEINALVVSQADTAIEMSTSLLFSTPLFEKK